LTSSRLAVSNGTIEWMSKADVARYFTHVSSLLFPLPVNMPLEHLVLHWAECGFDDVLPEFELEIVKTIVARLEQIDPHYVQQFEQFAGPLARLDAGCYNLESLKLLKDTATRIMHGHPVPRSRSDFHPEVGPSMIGGRNEFAL